MKNQKEVFLSSDIMLLPFVPQILQYNIIFLFLPLQAFPHIFCTECCSRDSKVFSFQSRKNIYNTRAKEYRAWPGLSLLFVRLQLWAGAEGTETTAELTSQCPYCCSSITPSHNQVTACSQVTWALMREQIISPGLTVSTGPCWLCLCSLYSQSVPHTSSPDSGLIAAAVQLGTARLWSQPGQKLFQINENYVQISWKKITICPHLIGFYLSINKVLSVFSH